MDILTALSKRQTTFSQRDASTLFRNVILALEEIHQHRIIHRDLKPDNIMFVNDVSGSDLFSPPLIPGLTHDIPSLTHAVMSNPNRLDIKIVDFGFAKELAAGETCIRHSLAPATEGAWAGYHEAKGTEYYWTPEQLGMGVNSAASDVWQCGVTLFCILRPGVPFSRRADVMNFQEPYQLPPQTSRGKSFYTTELSDGCRDLFAKIFTKQPSNRITCSGILQHSWIRDNAQVYRWMSSYHSSHHR